MNASKKQFVKIIQKYQGMIDSLCAVYFTCQEDKEDIRQEIILQLWKSLPSFREESNISTWIYRVSLNTIFNQKKKASRSIHPNELPDKDVVHCTATAAMDDDILLLRQIIDSLKDQDKALMILYLEGYKNKEMAKILHLSISNVSTRLHRIKEKIKEKFKINNHESRKS